VKLQLRRVLFGLVQIKEDINIKGTDNEN